MSGNSYSNPNHNNPPPLRRPSYATLAAGNMASALQTTSRWNTLGAAHAPSTFPSEQQAQLIRQRSMSSLHGMDMDGQGGNSANWKRPASSYEVPRLDGKMGCPLHDDHVQFITPSYLRQSRHVQRLKRQWFAHVAELQESVKIKPRTASLSTSSSNVNLQKMQIHSAHSHRGPVQDVIERLPPPTEEDKSHPLPSKWKWDRPDEDKPVGLEILADGSEVRLVSGLLKSHDEAASIRSDYPMPKECGLYYFEVTILSRGKDVQIGVGFSGGKVSLNRLPGWEQDSWAYHGDDGFSFACTASGKAYGPKFATQDVVGCGVNFRTGKAFFTKNGNFLGEAFSGIKGDHLYPSVGMKKHGEHLRVNFGRYPFTFDIDGMMEQERAKIMEEITESDVSALHPPDSEAELIHNLIGQYLIHEGFVETARAFSKDTQEQHLTFSGAPKPHQLPSAEENQHASQRQKIRKSILDGDIDRTLKHMDAFYKKVLRQDQNRNIYFRLRCRKFIEMMRRYSEMQAKTSSSPIMTKSIDSIGSNGHAEAEDDNDEEEDEDEMDDLPQPTDTQMELDDQLHREASKGLEPPPNDDVDMDASQELPPNMKASSLTASGLLNDALAYGRELQSEFGADPREEVKKHLSDIFAITAYTDPAESVVGDLLDPKGRVPIAEEVNGAILISQGRPPSAAIEKLFAQTEVLLDEAANKGCGSAALFSAKTDIWQAEMDV